MRRSVASPSIPSLRTDWRTDLAGRHGAFCRARCRRPPSVVRPAARALEGTRRGGIAALIEQELEEQVVILLSQTAGEEKSEPYIEIYARREGRDRIVTSIEFLGITNKTLGTPGRLTYLEKQGEILVDQVHLVEVDLLRGGAHVSAVPHSLARENAEPFDYHVSIRRFDRPSEFLFYPIPLERKLPTVKIPLLPGDPEVKLNLQSVFQRDFDAGPYRRAVAYGVDPVDPPLNPRQQAWAEELLSKAAESRRHS
jgi:hypothetical protein